MQAVTVVALFSTFLGIGFFCVQSVQRGGRSRSQPGCGLLGAAAARGGGGSQGAPLRLHYRCGGGLRLLQVLR